jgi:hypothetical protein
MSALRGGKIMKRQAHIRSATTVVLMILVVSLSLARSSQSQEHGGAVSAAPSTAATSAWSFDVIDGDATTDVGQYASIAIDPLSDRPYVSYYDVTNGDLRVAKYVESGGNCGPGDSWSCETVDSSGDVGKYTSIAIHTSTYPLAWKLGISYYDEDSYALKYAQYAWVSSAGDYQWTIHTIQGGSIVSKYGLHTGIDFDSTGVPHISYFHSVSYSPSSDSLMVAHRVGSGGNCGPGSSWQCDVVDSGNGVGRHTSMSLLPGDVPWVAYHDSGNDRLKYALYTGENGEGCAPSNIYWVCAVIDTEGGKYASADYTRQTGMHVAYYGTHGTASVLRYATHDGSGHGDCGPGNTWNCITMDSMGTSAYPMGISVATDRRGRPLFAYQEATGGPGSEVLKSAKLGAAEIVDGGGLCTSEGRFVSLDISPSGLAVIAYYERDDICTPTGRLKVACLQFHEVSLPLVLRDD